jgi:DNA-binding XRE family transcriptional regulator
MRKYLGFTLIIVFILARAVPIYKTDNYAKITFSVSKYPTKTLGQLLRKLRLEKGLEQLELAKKLRVHRNSIYDWESDRHKPYGKSMERLARFFRIGIKRLEDYKMEGKKE